MLPIMAECSPCHVWLGRRCGLYHVGAHIAQDDSDFFSSQGSINSLDDEIVRKECLSALERSGVPLSQAPAAWPSTSSSAPGATATPAGGHASSTTDMLVSC